jgi:hypothetical protein
MGYFTDTYETLKNNLLDYITNISRGQNVADIPLSLANRAQNNLWSKKPWCDLSTDVDVVLSGGSYSFPANFGRIISLWADLSGTGIPEYWYYEGNDSTRGYKLRDAFTKASGHAWTITFNYAQSSGVKMIYQRLLEDLSDDADLLFFPLNLMLLECQKIYLREKGDLKELAAIEIAFEIEFKDFCNAHQWINYDPSPVLRDRNANRVFVEAYSLDGSNISNGECSAYPRSYLGM